MVIYPKAMDGHVQVRLWDTHDAGMGGARCRGKKSPHMGKE